MPDPTTDFDTRVKLALYSHFAETGQSPSPDDMELDLTEVVEL